jgi:hypothetical protein
MIAGGTSCDPTRLSGRSRQSAIQRHSALCDNKRAPRDNPLVESLIKLRAVIGQNPFAHSCARISQLHNALAGVSRIYVHRANNYVSDSSLEYRICARSGASFCGARFQSNVERRASRNRSTEIAETFNLGMIAARSSMVPLCHDSVADDEDCAHRGIWARLTERLPRLIERRAHELFVSFSIHRFETSIVVLGC